MAKRKRNDRRKDRRTPAERCSAERRRRCAVARSRLAHASSTQIDHEILAAINRRGAIAQQIGELKQADDTAVYDPQRESEVLQQAVANNAGPLSDDAVRAVFRELVSGTRAVQTPIRVAYLGPEFTFSHLAAIERFGQSAELVPVGTIAAVFEEVERGQAQFGVVPMENSTDGRVSDTLDCFSRSPVRICGELPLRIHHCLLGIGTRDEVRTVYSKPQPLSQCRNWLARHLPKADLHEVAQHGRSRPTRQGRPDIGRRRQRPGRRQLRPARAGAEHRRQPGQHHAFRRSFRRQRRNRTGNDKTALMFEIAHQPGALADAMAIFKRNRLNMTWIESFPIPGHRGRYLFFVEFVGHQSEPPRPPGHRHAREKVAPPRSARLLCADRAGRVDWSESSVESQDGRAIIVAASCRLELSI